MKIIELFLDVTREHGPGYQDVCNVWVLQLENFASPFSISISNVLWKHPKFTLIHILLGPLQIS